MITPVTAQRDSEPGQDIDLLWDVDYINEAE